MKKNIANNITLLFSILTIIMSASYLSVFLVFVIPSMRSAQNEKHKGEIKALTSILSQELYDYQAFIEDNAQWTALDDIVREAPLRDRDRYLLREIYDENTLELYSLDYIGIYDRDRDPLLHLSTPSLHIGKIFSMRGKKYFFTHQPNGKNRMKSVSGYTSIEGRAYMFLSHIILGNTGEGDYSGYLLLLKEIDEDYILDLEVKTGQRLELFIPDTDEPSLKGGGTAGYYSTVDLRNNQRVYYLPYMEDSRRAAYFIRVIVDYGPPREMLLHFFTGGIPILVMFLSVFSIKKMVHKTIVDPVLILHRHILLTRDSRRYIPLKHFRTGNEIDEVIVEFNHLMLEIKERKQEIDLQRRKLEKLAYIDHVTGLSTRRALDEKYEILFEGARRRGGDLSLIMIDIDYFKRYNDLYSHLEGDRILGTISSLLKDTFKRGSDLLSRYGGEEFVVVLSDTSLEEAVFLAERFQQDLAFLNLPHEASPFNQVTVSMGIRSEKISAGDSPRVLLREADEKLYSSKNSGRNMYTA